MGLQSGIKVELWKLRHTQMSVLKKAQINRSPDFDRIKVQKKNDSSLTKWWESKQRERDFQA